MTRTRQIARIVLFSLAALGLVGMLVGGYLVYRSRPPEIPEDPQRTAYENLKAASERTPELYFQNGFPRGAHVSVRVDGADPVTRATNFLQTYQDLYLQSDPNLALGVLRVTDSEEDVVFYQTYQGLPVYAAQIVVSLDGDRVYATIGGLLTDEVVLDTTPAIANVDAENIARADLNQPEAPILGQTTLLVFDQSIFDEVAPDPHLAWRVTIGDRDPWMVFVDAHTAEVIFKFSMSLDGAGLDDYDFEEWDATGGPINSSCYWDPGPFSIGDEDGLDTDYHSDTDAVNLWYFMQDAYLFYHNNFGRHSYDNDHTQIEGGIHAVLKDAPNATWWPECGIAEFSNGMVTKDIVVHELTHGVIQFTSNLTYANQPGALNESYADVMAALATGDWTMGEGSALGAIRSLSNPPVFGQPDRMSEFVTSCSPPDNGCVHTNSGITNLAAFLIAQGGTHPDTGVKVSGIGNGAMSFLFYSAMTSLPAGAQLIDARNATVAKAEAHYGPQTTCKVRNAFYAVGLGNPDVDCNGSEDTPDSDGDSFPFGQDNCDQFFNPKQTDLNKNGVGALCDPDDNGNSIPDYIDTQLANPYILCPTPLVPCDVNNYDGDNFVNAKDNCPHDVNNDQKDTDNDGEGDACDPDEDGDGWSNNDDNCPFTPNPDQKNSDGDWAGDACDPTPDCKDVFAWSTGMTLFGPNGEDIDIPPKPIISDPVFCSPFILLDDTYWKTGLASTKPDGSQHAADVKRGEDVYVTLPLPACLTDDPQSTAPDYRGHLMLHDLDPHIGVWVANDEGQSIGKAKPQEGAQVLRYRPQGGQQQFLILNLAALSEGETATFSLAFQCGLKDLLAGQPPPSAETEAPAPADTGAGNLSATPTYTATSSPSPTPTPTPTPALPVILSFSANPPEIDSGGSSNLTCQIQGAIRADIFGNPVDPVTCGFPVFPQTTTDYMLRACSTNADDSCVFAQTAVVVRPPRDTAGPTFQRVAAAPGIFYQGASRCGPNDVTISAMITDPSGIGQVVLAYRMVIPGVAPDPGWQSAGMSAVGGDTYQASLSSANFPTLLRGADGRLEFYVLASDGAGNAGQSATDTSVTMKRC